MPVQVKQYRIRLFFNVIGFLGIETHIHTCKHNNFGFDGRVRESHIKRIINFIIVNNQRQVICMTRKTERERERENGKIHKMFGNCEIRVVVAMNNSWPYKYKQTATNPLSTGFV